MNNTETVLEAREGTIKIIQYNKPKRKNAIDPDMYIRVTKMVNEAAKDSEVSVLVVTGTGDYYSSGNDLVAAMERMGERDSLMYVLKDFIDAFITFPKLLIAIVNGPAIGVAATTLGLFDLVFASESAFFYTPFTKLGIVAEGCSTITFPRLIGDRKATEMLLFNHKMSAQEALECGFVNYLYKPEEIQSKVWDKIIEVSQLPTESVNITRSLIKRNLTDDLLKRNEMEIDELHKIWTSGTYLNNLQQFSDKKSNKSKL
ncbi:enoyl-CoA hydratase/isomerase domain-containing protein [Phthorimaea operculella]|nr:enoyl-CoA hydratase/isomerase domain-containing protein [Phthorimaea operculella]